MQDNSQLLLLWASNCPHVKTNDYLPCDEVVQLISCHAFCFTIKKKAAFLDNSQRILMQSYIFSHLANFPMEIIASEFQTTFKMCINFN